MIGSPRAAFSASSNRFDSASPRVFSASTDCLKSASRRASSSARMRWAASRSGRSSLGGSQCDVFKKKCTLPYAAREVAPIAWYSNGNFDADLFEASSWAFEDWDLAMRAAVQAARLVECRRTKGGQCDNKHPMWTGQMDDYQDALALRRRHLGSVFGNCKP